MKTTRSKSAASHSQPTVKKIQKRLTLMALAIVPTLLVTTPAFGGEIDENVTRLILTNACVGCNLAGADLSGAHLIGADLRETNLQGSNLSNANLEGADFTQADLSSANLTGAFLTNAVMNNAQLDQVNFTEATLYYVQVSGASVENINLTNAQVLSTPLSVGGDINESIDEIAPELNGRLPHKPAANLIVDPHTFHQSETVFPSDLFLLDENELIDLPAPLIPVMP